MNARRTAVSTALHLALGAYALLTLAPFLWALLSSFKTLREIQLAEQILPVSLNLDAYRQILAGDFTRWFFNALKVALLVTAASLFSNTLAGYALARLRFRGRGAVFQMLLLVIMVPSQVTMIPAYLVVAHLGLADTHTALFLTSVVSISSIFMMRQFFVNFPREIEEAAKLDGCGPLATFWHVVVPMALPALVTQGIFIFMGVWNEFMKPLLYISSPENYMLTQGLNAASKVYEKTFAWNLIMAGSVVSILPILALYIGLNKYFLRANDSRAGSK
jgi:multiple sugar transport system permease protein